MYQCIVCNYKTRNKSDYRKHMNTKKHKKNTELLSDCKSNVSICDKMSAECNPFVSQPSKTYKCSYCEKEYKHRQSLLKHTKTCIEKIKAEKDKKEFLQIQELVKLLNEQLEQKNKQIEEQNQLIERRDKQIETLLEKTGMNTTYNTIFQTHNTQNIKELNHQVNQVNNIKNQTNNIKLLGFKQTDYSHLTDDDYKQCIAKCNFSIPRLIEKVHFNKDKPENHNIYISNLKNKYVMIFDGEKWIYKNRDQEIDNLLDNGNSHLEYKIEDWLEKGKEFPTIMKKFERYMANIEKDEVLNMIKEEIKLLLFNNRSYPKLQI